MSIILGIDPGSRITGYGLINVCNNKLQYIDSGCIRTTPTQELSLRLLQIFEGISELMRTFSPTEVAIEDVFVQKNVRSALILGHARGVAMVAAAQAHQGVNIKSYTARQVKQALVGYGAAEKVQMQHMVKHLLMLSACPQSDAADALAIAICHSNQMNRAY